MNHKLDTEVHTVWFWLYEVLEQEKLNYGDRNQNSGCWWGLTRKRHEEFSEVMKMVYFLIGVQFTWVYISVRLTARLRSISLYVNYTLIKDCNPQKKNKNKNTQQQQRWSSPSTFLPTKGNFYPEYNMSMPFNIFITCAYVLKQDILLFCLSLNFVYITTYIHIYVCMNELCILVTCFFALCMWDLSIWYQ